MTEQLEIIDRIHHRLKRYAGSNLTDIEMDFNKAEVEALVHALEISHTVLSYQESIKPKSDD